MALTIIWASPNDDGLTAAAKDQILAGVLSAGGDVDVLHLNKRDIRRCFICEDGWGICRSEGRCIIPDDFADIYGKVLAGEGVVWITPVYWHDLAENLKAFLDRLRRCETGHNHLLKDRKCLLVACAGGTGRGATKALVHFEETLNHMGMIAVDRLPITQFSRGYMLPAVRQAGQSFAKSLR